MRLRLTLWVSVIITLVIWVTALLFWLYARESMNELEARRHAQVSSRIARDIELTIPGVTRDELNQFEDFAFRSNEFEYVFLDVYSVNGDSVVHGSDSYVPPEMLPLETAAGSIVPTVIDDESVFRIMNGRDGFDDLDAANLIPMVGSDGKPYLLLFATSNWFADTQLALVTRLIQGVFVISPLVGLVSGWFISGIAVAPIYRAQEIIQQMNPEMLQRPEAIETNTNEVDELSREVRAARDRIRKAFESQERFLANVSHEIKTPIAVMLVESQTINLEGLPEEVADFVESVQDEMKRLGKLVESFLTLTRLKDGHDRSSGKLVSVNEIVMDSVEHCSPMARQHGVRLIPHLLDDEDQVELCLSGEPELLVTMLDNLVRNAIRFSKTSDKVQLDIEFLDMEVVLIVRDEGPGIPEDRIDHIFDRFSQAGNERRGRGHGLGLTIAQGIAELHGGSISAQNTDPGCEFRIKLPVLEV